MMVGLAANPWHWRAILGRRQKACMLKAKRDNAVMIVSESTMRVFALNQQQQPDERSG